MPKESGQNNNMEPDFSTLQPIAGATVQSQPDFATLQPVSQTPVAQPAGYNPISSWADNVNQATQGETQTWKDFPSAASNDIHQIAGGLISGKGQGLPGVGKELLGAGEGTVNLVGDSIKALFAPLAAAAQAVGGTISDNPIVQGVASSPVGAPLDLVNTVSQKANSWAQANPNKAHVLSSAINIVGSLLGEISGAPEESIPNAKTVASQALEDVKGGVQSVTDTLGKIKDTVVSPEDTNVQKIADTISPKLTPKEMKLAQAQGRIITGDEPTLLRGGTPDQVLPSDKTTNAAFTISKQVPDAAEMSQPDLYTALDARTTDMAQNLKPEMEKVPLTPESLTKMNTDWQALKANQIQNADATEEANVAKLQKQFEANLNELSTDNNLNDVWDTRKTYDDSVPNNVKNANSQSDARLQMKKELWLQNREILNNIINDSKSGLGETSRQAFSDMSDMYDAKAQLLTKAKVNLIPQPSKIVQWMKAHPYLTRVGATAAGGEILHKVVTGSF